MRSLKHYLKTTTALPIGLGVVAAGLLGGPLVEHTLAPAQALAQGENPEAVCAPACEPCAPACEPCAAACEPCGPCAAAGVMTECAVPGMENPCAVCAPCEADAMPLGAAGSLDNPEAACGPSEPCAAACAPCPAACEPCAPDAMCAAENMCAAECEPCAPDAMCAAANPDAMCAPCAPDAEAACAPCGPCAAAEMPELTDEQDQALYDCIQESVAGGGWTQSEMAEGTAFLEWENFTTAPYISTTHGSRYAVNYANPVAAEQYGLYEQIEAIPEGGILAKPTFTVNAVGQALLGPLFLMERAQEGDLPASNDWIYTTINPDGSVAGRTGGVNSDAMQSCADCHMGTGAATDDLLFLPEAYRR